MKSRKGVDMDKRRLFVASCLALVATSMAFSLRTDILPALRHEFGFTEGLLGTVIGPGLWGFAITIVLGGIFLDQLGMKKMMALAFLGHVVGVILTINATGFYSLFVAMLFIGMANGLVEAVINPLVATLYTEQKTKYLNRLHAWWPGGLILGGLMGYGLTKLMGLDTLDPSTASGMATLSLGWKIKSALVLIPTLVYGYLMWGQVFPKTERVASGVRTSEMWKESLRPLFVFFLFLMMLTAATELGPDQWVGSLLEKLVGIQGILMLVYTAGLMFVLRQFFAGWVIDRFTPLGTLCLACVISAVGLYVLSGSATALGVMIGATIFGIGKTYLWPTMLGFVSERFPKGGALALGLMGGAGMFSAGWLMAPIMGGIQDHYFVKNLSTEIRTVVTTSGKLDPAKLTQVQTQQPRWQTQIEEAQRYSAVMTYRWVAVVPALLTFVFFGLFIYFRRLGGYHSIELRAGDERRASAVG